MKKRIIGILLCVIMVCSLLPLSTFAVDVNILHYDYNGGKFGDETFVDNYPDTDSGKYCCIMDTVPVLDGYIFNGWNTEKDGSGDSYSYGDTFYFETSRGCYDTLYAQWKLPNWIDYADTSWYESDPNADSYTISTAEQLAGLAKLVNGGYRFENKTVKLADNISLTGKEWTPIGTTIDSIAYGFYGIFDGDGYTVSGLYIYAPKSDSQALFGLTYSATIKNLRVSGSVTGSTEIAGIVAFPSGTLIENCVNDCTVTGNYNVGGIAGSNVYSIIENCFNTVEINTVVFEESAKVGGIVGCNKGFVSNCYNIGNISGRTVLGGIAGETYDISVSELYFTDPIILAKCVTNIYNCYNIGSVTGEENSSGICGIIYGYGSASKCYNLGILESTETKVYGVAYALNTTTEEITDCYYLADCNASGNVFANNIGTALSSENFRKQESFSGFDFNTTWEMGALAPVLKAFDNEGDSDNPYPVANLEMLEFMRDSVNKSENYPESLFYDCDVVLQRDIDLGCDNNNQWVPIGNESSYFTANFDGKGHIITGLYINKPTEDYIGFIGQLSAGFKIKNLGVYGTVIGKNYVGGIAGFAYSQFENCFNACDVTGNSYVAGVSGSGAFSVFSNCYNIGNITCKEDYCGGITTDPYLTDFGYCYNTGTINCKGDYVDAIANNDMVDITYESCYYLSGCNTDGTVFDTIDGVSALSEADFADKSKFTGWDFDNTWDLSDTAVKRPLLKNAAEKGTSLNPFKVVYTDTEGGAAIHEFYYATANSPTPNFKTDVDYLINWKFVNWDKTIAAKVTGDVTYTAKIAIKASNTVRYHGNGGTCISYGKPSEFSDKYLNSDTCEVNSSKEFTRDGFKLIGWNTKADGSGTTYKIGDTFKFEIPHNGDIYHFYAVWQDTEKPVFVGLENEEYYCYSVKFKVTDNGGIASVKVGDTTLTADKDGYYTINFDYDQDDPAIDYTVTATDLDGNITAVSITLRSFHAMSGWNSDGEYFWRVCGFCGEPDSTKYKIPTVNIVGDDTVCRNEDYKFTVTLPSGWDFSEYDSITYQLQQDGTYLCVAENNIKNDTLTVSFEIKFDPEESDHGYFKRINKTVTVVDHKGGTANCKDKAVCTECGKPYGETDPKNHKEGLTHFAAKPATVNEAGNIEYWYCASCDKCFSDKDGNTEIAKAETVLAQLTPETNNGNSQGGTSNSPTTGDNSNIWIWIAVLAVSAIGLISVIIFNKKKSH